MRISPRTHRMITSYIFLVPNNKMTHYYEFRDKLYMCVNSWADINEELKPRPSDVRAGSCRECFFNMTVVKKFLKSNTFGALSPFLFLPHCLRMPPFFFLDFTSPTRNHHRWIWTLFKMYVRQTKSEQIHFPVIIILVVRNKAAVAIKLSGTQMNL